MSLRVWISYLRPSGLTMISERAARSACSVNTRHVSFTSQFRSNICAASISSIRLCAVYSSAEHVSAVILSPPVQPQVVHEPRADPVSQDQQFQRPADRCGVELDPGILESLV